MSTEVIMPQMGESIFEGTITKWLKRTGDNVEKDEPLFEISSDKVDAEIPSPIAGVLSEIKVPEGATVQVNSVVAIIANTARAATSLAPFTPEPLGERATPGAAAPVRPASKGEHRRSSPLVQGMAKDNNVDLDQISGTGFEGRVTKEDLLRYLGEQLTNSASASPSAVREASTSAPPAMPLAAAIPAPIGWLAEADNLVNSALPGELVPLSKMRTIIAQRMVESAQTRPHVHTVFKVDMTRIVRLREREKVKYQQRNGVKLTYMPFIAIAAVETLRKFPIVNASMESGSIRYHQSVNLGIAVAVEWGLIVPVINYAEERKFLGLARAIADLAERARAKRLRPDEASGSTFTITNSGVYGEAFGTPIINPPESAILAIGGLKKEPVVRTDADGNDTIAIRSLQHFCLGFDHRIIDGAEAGKFMSEIKKVLENWDREIG